VSKENCIPFTVPTLNSLKAPLKGTIVYKDTKADFLSLYITSTGIKTFFVRKRIKGRDQRLVIGRYPIFSIEQARRKALIFCGTIADRKDPLEEARKEKQNKKTFGQHCNEYMERYSKLHKKSWKYDEYEINQYLSDWFPKRLSDIKKSDVESKHEKIGRENGKTHANTIVRRISALFNKAIEWGWEGINPAKGVKKFKERSRDRFIMPNELPYFLEALREEQNEDLRDYITLLLMTGARKTNAKMMRWEEISVELKQWRIPDPKNGEPYIIPLTHDAMKIIERRRVNINNSPWVFPQKSNPQKHIIDPKKAYKRIVAVATLKSWNTHAPTAEFINKHRYKLRSYYAEYTTVEKLMGLAEKENYCLPPVFVDLRIHDIRRTFGSYQALAGASLPIIGKSLGHKSLKSTQIYARLNLDPVRASIEKATEAMFSFGQASDHQLEAPMKSDS